MRHKTVRHRDRSVRTDNISEYYVSNNYLLLSCMKDQNKLTDHNSKKVSSKHRRLQKVFI